MWGFLAQLWIKLLVLLCHEIEGWKLQNFLVVKILYILKFYIPKFYNVQINIICQSVTQHLFYIQVSKKDWTLFFIFLFLGAQCVESGVSFTDWIFEKGTIFFGHPVQ